MAQSQSDSIDTSQDQDRRNFERYAVADSAVTIIAGERKVEGVLYDQSIGGVAIVVPLAFSVRAGQEVKLDSEGDVQTAFVRAVREHAEGGFRISLSWDQDDEANAPELPGEQEVEVAHFFRHEDCVFACVPKTTSGDEVEIELWNGKSFPIASSSILELTRDHRRSELNTSASKLKTIAAVYELPASTSFTAMVETVLEFEFSLAR